MSLLPPITTLFPYTTLFRSLEEALKWEDTSIQNEERFENLETKSRILDAMGRKDESAKAYSTAFEKATAVQLYVYARGIDRKSTRLNSSHRCISYAVFCLKK